MLTAPVAGIPDKKGAKSSNPIQGIALHPRLTSAIRSVSRDSWESIAWGGCLPQRPVATNRVLTAKRDASDRRADP